MIIVNRLNDDSEFEQIGRVEDGEITDGEDALTAIDDRDVWENLSEAELADRFSGPRVMVGIEDGDGDDEDVEEDFQDVGKTPSGVPGNAQGPVRDESDIPDDAQVFEGPRGGVYFVPSGEEAEPGEEAEAVLTDFEDAITDEISQFNRSDFGTGEEKEELISAMSDAVRAGAPPDAVAGIVADRFDETEGATAFHSTEQLLSDYSNNLYGEGGDVNRLAEDLHDRAEFPEQYPDVPPRDTGEFDDANPDLRDELNSRTSPDTLYETFSSRKERGQETFDILEDFVADGGDPAAAVLAASAVYDDNTVARNDREDTASRVRDFAYSDMGDSDATAELQQEFRKYNRDADNYPRELAPSEREMMNELEAVVEAEQDDRMGANEVSDLSAIDLRNGVDDRAAELIRDGAPTQNVVSALEVAVGDDDNRSNFYKRVSANIGSRETEYGEATYNASRSDATSNARDTFQDQLDEDEQRQFSNTKQDWFFDVYSGDTAPLFQMAADQTGNEQVPDDVFDVLNESSDDAESNRGMYETANEHATEVLRDTFGDEVTAYRGLSPEGEPSDAGSTDISRDVEDAAAAGRDAELEHRTIESWSSDPLHARKFAGAGDDEPDGVIIERQIDVEDVMLSSHAGQLSAAEDEFAVAHDDEAGQYTPEQVTTADELRDGADAAKLLEQSRRFAMNDDSGAERTEQRDVGKDSAAVTVHVSELPPVNWLRETRTDTDDETVEAHKEDDGVRLHYPQGGVAHTSESQYRAWLEDVAGNGGRIIDTKGFANNNDRVWPPDEPDAHDPRMVVYGLDETEVLALLDRYPDVGLQINTDHDHNAKSSGNGDAEAKAAKTDEVLLRAFKRQILPPSVDAIEKDAWTSDEDVPEYVVEALADAFDGGGIFDRFESISGRVADTISDTLEDALTQPQGWSLDSMVDRLSDELPRADPVDLETIARTESASVLNDAREAGYRDRGLDDAKFYWQGPDDSRTTDACEDLKDDTNPSHGGDPVSLPKLVNKERDVHGEYFPNLSFRKHVIHPNERHTFVRETGTGRGDEPDVDIDVDVPGADAFDAEDAPASPAEMSKSHGEDYGDVVDRVAKSTNVTRRVGQIEDALGAPLPVVLRECLESAGSTRGAHTELNRRLSEADDWHIDEDGQVSTATIYEWVDRYQGHVDHLV